MGSSLPFVSEENRIGALWREGAADEMAFLNLTEEQVRAGVNVRTHLAYAEHDRIAAANQRIERATVEGLGQLECQVPAHVYFALMQVHGRDCWQDADFLRSYQKNNPGAKPKTVARKTTVRAPGLSFA